MHSLTFSRGEKLSPNPHSLKVPLDLSRIVKSTGCRCVGRKVERRIMEARFSDSDFSSGLVIQSARSVPLPPSPSPPPPCHWSTERMNESSLRDLGDFLATVNGTRCRARARKKGSRLVFTFHRIPRMPTQVSLCPFSELEVSRARDLDALSPGFLTPLTTFYLKFNLKWGALLTNFRDLGQHGQFPRRQ